MIFKNFMPVDIDYYFFFVIESAGHSHTIGKERQVQPHRVNLPRKAKSDSCNILWPSTGNNTLQDDVLSYIGGYLVNKWLSKVSCTTCQELIEESGDVCSTFITCKEFSHGALKRPSRAIINSLNTAEKIYMANSDILKMSNVLSELLRRVDAIHFPAAPCHPEMRLFFFKSYFITRLHHSCRLMCQSVKEGGRCRSKKEKKLNVLARRIVDKYKRTRRLA